MAWIWPGCATGPDLSVHGSGRAVYSQHHYVYLSWQTYRVHIYHAIHLVYSYLSILPSLHHTAEKNRAMFPPCTAHASNARGSSMRLVTLRYVPHTEAPPLSTHPATLMSQLTKREKSRTPVPVGQFLTFPPVPNPPRWKYHRRGGNGNGGYADMYVYISRCHFCPWTQCGEYAREFRAEEERGGGRKEVR